MPMEVDLQWVDNGNIHRNYCQIAEWNIARDALATWISEDNTGFEEVMDWARDSSAGPAISFVGKSLPGGGVRAYKMNVDQAYPLEMGGYTYANYIYVNFGAEILGHELGHFIGHGDLYYKENACLPSADRDGYLGPYDIMGDGGFVAHNAVNRWRSGFSDALYFTSDDSFVSVALPPSMSGDADGRTIAVIHPDRTGHPDELWVVENRITQTVTINGATIDFESVPFEGIYIYHVNADGVSPAEPLLSLERDESVCSLDRLEPHQGTFSKSSMPSNGFYDNGSSGFAISNISLDSVDTLHFDLTFH